MGFLQSFASWAGLFGFIGLAGLSGLKYPVEKGRDGGLVRIMALLGFAGLAGFWIPGVGAMGAAGALGLWNHQSPRLALWGRLGWLFLIGVPYLVLEGCSADGGDTADRAEPDVIGAKFRFLHFARLRTVARAIIFRAEE